MRAILPITAPVTTYLIEFLHGEMSTTIAWYDLHSYRAWNEMICSGNMERIDRRLLVVSLHVPASTSPRLVRQWAMIGPLGYTSC